jgi:hypothetical protein
VCVIKFSILALYHRIFGLSWLAWFCGVLTMGYLITNHVVLPLYTAPIDYYWNQWYGAQGKVQINEANVRCLFFRFQYLFFLLRILLPSICVPSQTMAAGCMCVCPC